MSDSGEKKRVVLLTDTEREFLFSATCVFMALFENDLVKLNNFKIKMRDDCQDPRLVSFLREFHARLHKQDGL